MDRPPLPPLTLDTATRKFRLAADAWSGHDPARVALACSPASRWRQRSSLLQGRAASDAWLAQERRREVGDRLVKEFQAFRDDRIAVRFACQWQDAEGLMHIRIASIKDLPIAESERLCRGPAARRPDGHAGLAGLGL